MYAQSAKPVDKELTLSRLYFFFLTPHGQRCIAARKKNGGSVSFSSLSIHLAHAQKIEMTMRVPDNE
jgi:hypothetical protein